MDTPRLIGYTLGEARRFTPIIAYPCDILEWHDGDTCRVLIHICLCGVTIERTIRVFGINAPELKNAGGEEARQYALSLAPVGSRVLCHTATGREQDKYGRWLAGIMLESKDDFAALMLEARQAVRYE